MGLDWQCCLAGSFKRAPRILIFPIAIDADYTFYVKSIETHVRAYLPLNISAVSSVYYVMKVSGSSRICSNYIRVVLYILLMTITYQN